ncbi:MAG: multiheme c-type cytochrome, partial [Thermoanaerobaculia bacterium]|nr:multiheme c-type cytochrome [Thermoanaerobaculia bacterium]
MRTAALLSAIAALAAAPAGAQIDHCTDCHLSRPDAPRPDHVADWSRSAHAAADVGCHECHGGRTDSFEPFTAHEGVGRG